MSVLTDSIQNGTEHPNQCNKTTNINKKHTDWKAKSKTIFIHRQQNCLQGIQQNL